MDLNVLQVAPFYFDNQCSSFNINVTENVKMNDLQYIESVR